MIAGIRRWEMVSKMTIKLLLRAVFVIISLVISPAHSGSEIRAQPIRQLYKVVTNDNKVGFIDRSGKIVIGFDRMPAEASVGNFSEGRAPICFRDKPPSIYSLHCGFIDQTGNIAIPPRFVLSSPFSEGLAWIRTESLIGFIDRLGKVVIALPESFSFGFHDGLAALQTRSGWGFINGNGAFISTKRYVRVERFSEGLAAVAEGTGENAKYGFINQSGEVAIPLRFDPPLGPHGQPVGLGRFTEGLAPARIGKLYGYIDHKGNTVIPPTFRDAGQFSEGLASVTTFDRQKGYIDKTGRLVITLKSATGDKFNDGLALIWAEVDGRTKLGYIDHTGKIVIEPKFDAAFDFADGVAEVYFSEKANSATEPVLKSGHGYIDKAGRFVWRTQ